MLVSLISPAFSLRMVLANAVRSASACSLLTLRRVALGLLRFYLIKLKDLEHEWFTL